MIEPLLDYNATKQRRDAKETSIQAAKDHLHCREHYQGFSFDYYS